MLKTISLWQDLASLVKGTKGTPEDSSAEDADFWRYVEPAGKEPDPLKRNVLQWRRLILSTKDAVSVFAGQPVQVIGYVDRSNLTEPRLFNLVRPVIRCCLDDTVPLGIPVFSQDTEQLTLGTWLMVTGLLMPLKINQRESLVVKPDSIKLICKPERAYINGVF
ncbi:TIGR03943 family putative permease subunit [Nodosilinea sp. AN01ver1]|uniref:TIGR03943 family putative permease subunit n=1 Tax=Nodosilinea sp. AN01ver1 TaxID=3423362 RepID=UPI003D310995